MKQQKLKKKSDCKLGDGIRYLAGAYKGKTGWIELTDDGKANVTGTGLSVYTLVDKGEDLVLSVCVRKTSFSVESEPQCYEEAALLQIPKISALMNQLARELAKCRIEPNSKNIEQIFKEKNLAAKKIMMASPNSVYYDIHYYDEDDDGML